MQRRRHWYPTPVLLPGKSHGWRNLEGCSPRSRWGSDTTERLRFHFSLSCIGEGNGNPLQCSCLENPRDGGAWWAAVYGVAQSQTRPKWLSLAANKSSPELRGNCPTNYKKKHVGQNKAEVKGFSIKIALRSRRMNGSSLSFTLSWKMSKMGITQSVHSETQGNEPVLSEQLCLRAAIDVYTGFEFQLDSAELSDNWRCRSHNGYETDDGFVTWPPNKNVSWH